MTGRWMGWFGSIRMIPHFGVFTWAGVDCNLILLLTFDHCSLHVVKDIEMRSLCFTSLLLPFP
jgi:hypothetical protein